MRAKEIITELSRPKNRSTAHEILLRAGYHMLGSGCFASVYQKPGAAYVLKLFDADDHAYMAFLSLVAGHPNRHFPKFFGKPVRVSPGFSAVRMEPLGKYRGDPSLLKFYTEWRGYKGEMPMRMGDAEELFYELPDLKVALDLMIDAFIPGYRFDIQQDNIMVRGTELVFTDPIATLDSKGTDRQPIPMMMNSPEPEPVVLKPRDRKRLDDILSDDDLMRELGYD